MSYTSSSFSLYLGALELQFSLGPFYTFLSISLMVRYQLESIHLDDYNLIYRQNKNMGFTKILTAFPLKKPNILLFTTIPQNQHGIYPKQLHHTCIGGLELLITKPLVKIPRIHTKVHQSIQNHRNRKNSLFISYQLRFYPHEFNKSRVRVISQQNPRKKGGTNLHAKP